MLPLFCLLVASAYAQPNTTDPTKPFDPDEHTMLLYHLDEGEGTLVRDSSRFGNDAEVRGPMWQPGRYGGALWFDGKDDCVFREVPASIRDLKQITVECWLNQDYTTGRRFMAGQDVGFHFEVDDAVATSISLYNKGGGVPNAEGKPHQQCFSYVGRVRSGRWHHVAITYDGDVVSHFVDGELKARQQGPKDFFLGAPSRGLWLGCYVGMDYWFSGLLDEFRVSDCVRYDPERKLSVGGRLFDMPQRLNKPVRPANAVRVPRRTGEAKLQLTLRKRYGGNAAGWVYLKPPDKPAVIVGQYALKDVASGEEVAVECDVSDELAGDGCYILGLEQTDSAGYIAATQAVLWRGAEVVARWQGEVLSRRTFSPPLLVPLQVGSVESRRAKQIMLLPMAVDRAWGGLELDDSLAGEPTVMTGDGYAEWWVHIPAAQTYRVTMRYAGAGRPCDFVIDGDDLNQFDMCATNGGGRSHPVDAFWEYQGTTTLSAGAHWLRLQDVLPDIVALRLEPVSAAPPSRVPWQRFPVPEGDFLAKAVSWQPAVQLGDPREASLTLAKDADPTLRFSVTFANTDDADLFAGDCVRFVHRGAFDLEPFGRLSFRFQGQATHHALALWLMDAKGDEKLLCRLRDTDTSPQEISVPISFEGNDVFDPGHVVAVCVELDEGNVRRREVNPFAGALIAPRFERRDVLVMPDGYADALAAARAALIRSVGPAASRSPVGRLPSPLLTSPGFRPWTRPVVPEEHPLFSSTEPKPVTRQTLGYGLHFTGSRDISAHSLDSFHRYYDFGDICWPHIGILPQRRNYPDDTAYQNALKELEARLIDVRDRGLILWDIWGYVPFGEAGPTPQVMPEHHAILQRILGDKFLGYDNGEQDGRYIGSYADRGAFTDRRGGWEDFVKWDQGICNDSMNFMNATGSLNFSHYYGERGCRTLGLETAQGLPSDTLMFAFLRGASKQYGRLTTQATSIWNRFGYNMYHDRRTVGGNGYGLGPHKGCSLSLHRRLFFQSYTGGDSIVGSETSQFTADTLENGAPELSPLGKQHLAIRQWVKEHPDRGTLYTPVAFLVDFYSGWNMPRHLYRGDKYKIWGKLPYEKGDYLIDGMFRMVWPGYEDCSYWRNERGFITPTPFGDIFDVLTSRCHADILKQYTCLMLLGDVEITPALVANLRAFVEEGGDLITDAKHARALPPELTGATLGDEAHGLLSYRPDTGETFEEPPYTYTVLTLTEATPLLINERGHALVTAKTAGKGRVIVGAVDYWMTDRLTYRVPELVNMEPPYMLLRGVRALLSSYFGSFSPVTTDPDGLNVRTCCFDNEPKRLLIGLTNNDLFADWTGTLKLRVGHVISARDLRAGTDLPADSVLNLDIPAGDVALLELRLR